MRFGFLGRIEPEKGIEVLLAATRGLGGDWRLMIAGRGVIASRIGGLPEAAQGAGMSALVEPGDTGALTAALQAAVDQPERWLFAAVGAPAWSEASIVEAHRAVYRQVLSRRSSMISAEPDQA